jgi:hypothetical protein
MSRFGLAVKWIGIGLVLAGLSLSVVGTAVKAWIEVEMSQQQESPSDGD